MHPSGMKKMDELQGEIWSTADLTRREGMFLFVVIRYVAALGVYLVV